MTKDEKFTFLFPCDAERVLKIDNHTLNISLIGPEFLEGENKYQNGFVSRDGCVYGGTSLFLFLIIPSDLIFSLNVITLFDR